MRSSCARPRSSALATLCLALSFALGADAPDDAQKTLAAVQKRYDGVHDLRASFVQKSFSPAVGKESESHGTVVVQRPGKMRWEYAAPDARVIVLDGAAIKLWNPDDKQLQIAAVASSGVSPTALSFLMGQGSLADSFTASQESEPGRGERGLLLKPKGDATFESLVLWLDPKTLQLRESVVVDLFGNRTRVRFDGITENGGVDASAFDFKPPPGAEVIDLRH
ncbi:MAG TPA: outer membrane lipoprotein carrier protein LolA [Myxococcota bacterium]|nr:outer membrane lipoprotein carrier protein LolA [Myxococcota bacterium]